MAIEALASGMARVFPKVTELWQAMVMVDNLICRPGQNSLKRFSLNALVSCGRSMPVRSARQRLILELVGYLKKIRLIPGWDHDPPRFGDKVIGQALFNVHASDRLKEVAKESIAWLINGVTSL